MPAKTLSRPPSSQEAPPASTRERDERDLQLPCLRREGCGAHAEVQVAPSGRRRRDLLPLAGPQQQAHTSAASSSSSNGIAAEQASLDATIAPATVALRTASGRGNR